MSELLRWRLRHPESLRRESLPDDARDRYRRVVDQLVSATQLRHPAVGDLARQVRYRCFDAPLIAAERARAQQQVRAELDRLSPDPEVRAAQIDAIVASGEAILGVFAERHHAVMLEVMTRRYYRIRPLKNVQVTERSGRPLLTAEYVHDGRDYLVIATVADGSENVPVDRPAPGRAPVRPHRARRPLRHLPGARGTKATPTSTPARTGSAASSAPSRPPSDGSRSRFAALMARSAAARPGLPSTAARTGRPPKTGPSAACIRWSPNGWACGGSPDSS